MATITAKPENKPIPSTKSVKIVKNEPLATFAKDIEETL